MVCKQLAAGRRAITALWVPKTCATWPDAPLAARHRVRHMPGRSWPDRAWDDLRLAGLKLIFLIVTRAVPLLGLSRREWWWKDAEILMLRHQLAVAERGRPRAHPRLDVAGPGVAGAPCGDGGGPGKTRRGDTGGSTASSRGPASRWRHPRSGRSSRAPGSTGLRAGMARAGRSSSGPRRRGSWRWTSSP